MVPHLCLYLRYWWNKVNFSSTVITFDIMSYSDTLGEILVNLVRSPQPRISLFFLLVEWPTNLLRLLEQQVQTSVEMALPRSYLARHHHFGRWCVCAVAILGASEHARCPIWAMVSMRGGLWPPRLTQSVPPRHCSCFVVPAHCVLFDVLRWFNEIHQIEQCLREVQE